MGKDQAESTPLTARDHQEAIAYSSSGLKTTGNLLTEAQAVAAVLPDGQYMINLHTNRYDFLLGFCAAMMAGHCTLMPPNRQPETLAGIERLYPGSYRIGDRQGHQSESVGTNSDALASAPLIGEESPAIIAFTSGSTGKPAATQKSWHTLRISTRCNFEALLEDIPGTSNLVATVPCQHMWGFETAVLIPLLCPAVISYANPFYPLDIANALAEIPAPRILVSSPLHIRALRQSGVEVPALARILTATAPMSTSEAAETEDHFQTEVLDAFGCTESGVIATRRTARSDIWKLAPAFSLAAGEAGTKISAAHLPEPVTLQDRVELIGKHSFKWLGRNQDMVNIAGKRGSLADLNARLLNIDKVRDGVIFHPSGASRLAALVVAPNLEARDVMEALRPQIEPAFLPRPLLMVDQLPRQATGKLSQSAIADLFNALNSNKRSSSSSM